MTSFPRLKVVWIIQKELIVDFPGPLFFVVLHGGRIRCVGLGLLLLFWRLEIVIALLLLLVVAIIFCFFVIVLLEVDDIGIFLLD